jgi:hypothetical protein
MDVKSAGQLRAAERVFVRGRSAIFLYERGKAAVIRYPGETESRAVPLSKVVSSS